MNLARGVALTCLLLAVVFVHVQPVGAQEAEPQFSGGNTANSATATEIVGSQYGSAAENLFAGFGQQIECSSSSFTATDGDGIASDLTLTPSYSGCSSESLAATVTTSSCVFTAHQPEAKEAGFTGTLGLNCEPEDEISIHIYAGESHSFSVCTYEYLPGAELGGHVQYANSTDGETGRDEIQAEIALAGLEAVKVGLCGAKVTTSGEYTSNVTLVGYKDGNTSAPHDLWVEPSGEDPEDGIFIGGRTDAEMKATEIVGSQYGSAAENHFAGFGQIERSSSSFTATDGDGIASDLTLTPSYSGCSAESLPATVTTNSCVFTAHQPEAEEGGFTGTLGLNCEPEDEISIHIYAGEGHGFSICTVEYLPGAELGGHVQYANSTDGETGRDEIQAEIALTGLEAVKVGLCGAKVTTSGEYTSNVTLVGYKDGDTSAPHDLWIDDGAAHLAETEEAAETEETAETESTESTEAIVTAGETPELHEQVEFNGVQYGEKNEFQMFETLLSCPAVEMSGADSDGTAVTLNLQPKIAGCKYGGLPITTTTNGCELIFAELSTFEDPEDRYKGSVDLSCPAEAAIELHVYAGEPHSFVICTWSIDPAENLSHAVFQATSSEGLDHLNLDMTLSGLTARQEGICGAAEDTNATWTSQITLRAYDEETETSVQRDLWISE